MLLQHHLQGSDIEAIDTADVSTGADADLEVTKTWVFEKDLDNNNIANVDDQIKFIITVKNTGNVTLTNIDYDDTFLDGSTPANLLSFDAPNNPRSLTWISADNGSNAHGTLKAGETAIYHAYYTITQAVYDSGEATNTVTFLETLRVQIFELKMSLIMAMTLTGTHQMMSQG